MKSKFEIIIPTNRFNRYLDEALSSCLSLKLSDKSIRVNINSESEEFKNSKYWNHSEIQWRYSDKKNMDMYESFNDAIRSSNAEWIFILSDDDVIHPNFLKNIDLNELNENDLYATRIRTIDENGIVLGVQERNQKISLDNKNWFDDYFNLKINNHVSLFLFSKKLFNKVNGFSKSGYPNGYFMDTIFHGKLVANSDKIIFSDEVCFSRRVSTFQETSKFYLDKRVNKYFDVIIDEMIKDNKFKVEILSRFTSKQHLKKHLLHLRFFTEWTKLNNPMFNVPRIKKLNFLKSFYFSWEVSMKNKLISFIYVLAYPIITALRPIIKKNK